MDSQISFKFSDILSSLDHIKGGIPLIKLSRRLRLGSHKSVFFGPSNILFDIREYDEDRDPSNLIVWSLYDPDEGIIWAMKTIEEHEVPIRFFVDLSSSAIDAGIDHSKRRMLLEAVGFIGTTGARYQDQIGLTGFTDRIVLNLPPKGGVFSFVHMLKTLYDFMERHPADGKKINVRKTDFAVMLDFIRRTCDRQCFIPVISDFVGFERMLASNQSLRLLKFIASKHEVIFIFLDNPLEVASMAGPGSLRLENIETGDQITISRKQAHEIGREIRRQRRALRKELRKIGIYSVVLEPGKQINRLRKFFMIRHKLLRF
ncbi:MAG: hypothetical protein A3B86_02440 [Candidatus Yanofskybacteria bacterium RIFCSPHIGHO2_02_FULL_38_22b]|uniref:DUF58 domain-containing protein n=1 Tax=Candidatus Yanofskybacteria bacterium RIFCSPHIGHO2_02_FULL_38_22b TaxID=1802673 RepID=A0A1F8F3G9_9BACT|nr:MAG: hypothetical protein A3B86_02440 [Candidatus Yanofskybacteria bacterium RIFCSPHIGHO2_02_FULL_38_22b]OGN20305.1 MAG: hypothetical protein A2910_03275 [Candidatus Yanofskybacteria bacterium RIFCSPLOWO2_01_FULL_39_28]